MADSPLFPLHTVIFPGGVLPLRIFEPRYLDMVKTCTRDDSAFGIFLIRSGSETGTAATIHATGTLCKIIDWETLPDGLLGITAYGEHKVRVNDLYVSPNQLLRGNVSVIESVPEQPLPQEFESFRTLLQKIITRIGVPYATLPSNYDKAGWVGARLVELLPIETLVKQRLLEIDDHIARLYHLKDAMQTVKYNV